MISNVKSEFILQTNFAMEFCSTIPFFQDEYIDMIKKPSKIKRNDIQF